MGLYPRFRPFTLETFIDVLVSTLQPDLKHPFLFSNHSHARCSTRHFPSWYPHYSVSLPYPYSRCISSWSPQILLTLLLYSLIGLRKIKLKSKEETLSLEFWYYWIVCVTRHWKWKCYLQLVHSSSNPLHFFPSYILVKTNSLTGT